MANDEEDEITEKIKKKLREPKEPKAKVKKKKTEKAKVKLKRGAPPEEEEAEIAPAEEIEAEKLPELEEPDELKIEEEREEVPILPEETPAETVPEEEPQVELPGTEEAPAEEPIAPEPEPISVEAPPPAEEKEEPSVEEEVEKKLEEETREERPKVGPEFFSAYSFDSEGIPVNVRIGKRTGEFVPVYEISIPGIAGGTKLILETKLRGELVTEVKLDISEILDPKRFKEVKEKFLQAANRILDRNFPTLPSDKKNILAVYLIQNTLGLGELESLLDDEQLEEVVINNAREPVWVYHKRWGWCKSNLRIRNEETIYDYASVIARKIGRQINILNPMLDAHLPSGDRVNSTLFPISNFGNTITIRKFSRNPWTITNFLKSKAITSEVAGLIWLCIQNELSLIVAGGTGSGKTSFLNAMAGLIPANQRIISLEDTRELTLPTFLHWVPMTIREANPEGKGEVTMLDLMVNALRQRPDRILVGEIRRQREAEILFEAMHTGHSVYATLHADNAEQAVSRLTNPPINLPAEMLNALSGMVIQFRHRRFNIRRTLEFSEVLNNGKINTLYRWDVKSDKVKGVGRMSKLKDLLALHAGMDEREIEQDVSEKVRVLEWMVKKGYDDVDQVGKIISQYYVDPDYVLDKARKNEDW